MLERLLRPDNTKEEKAPTRTYERCKARAAKVADRFAIPEHELRRIALEKARAVGATGKGSDLLCFARTEGRLTQGPVGLYLRALSGRCIRTRGSLTTRLSGAFAGSINVLLDVPLQILPSGDVMYIRVNGSFTSTATVSEVLESYGCELSTISAPNGRVLNTASTLSRADVSVALKIVPPTAAAERRMLEEENEAARHAEIEERLQRQAQIERERLEAANLAERLAVEAARVAALERATREAEECCAPDRAAIASLAATVASTDAEEWLAWLRRGIWVQKVGQEGGERRRRFLRLSADGAWLFWLHRSKRRTVDTSIDLRRCQGLRCGEQTTRVFKLSPHPSATDRSVSVFGTERTLDLILASAEDAARFSAVIGLAVLRAATIVTVATAREDGSERKAPDGKHVRRHRAHSAWASMLAWAVRRVVLTRAAMCWTGVFVGTGPNHLTTATNPSPVTAATAAAAGAAAASVASSAPAPAAPAPAAPAPASRRLPPKDSEFVAAMGKVTFPTARRLAAQRKRPVSSPDAY